MSRQTLRSAWLLLLLPACGGSSDSTAAEPVSAATSPTPSKTGPAAWIQRPAQFAHRWDVEVIDADLSAGLVALRVTRELGELDCTDCQPARRCNYPGLDSPVAGVDLTVLKAGDPTPSGVWTIYESVVEGQSCTPHETAVTELAAAKRAMISGGLDPAKRLELTPPVGPPEAGAWEFQVSGHSVLVAPHSISEHAQLHVTGFNELTWPSDPMDPVQAWSIQVDGVRAFSFAAAGVGVSPQPEGLLVDGDRFAVVLTSKREWTALQFETLVSPVLSLSQPKPWHW